MKKVFISQPMNGLTDDEILSKRKEICNKLETVIGESCEVVDSFFEDFNPEKNPPLAYLGRSISLLATADIAYFGGEWYKARGCKIEHTCALKYGLEVYDEHPDCIVKLTTSNDGTGTKYHKMTIVKEVNHD